MKESLDDSLEKLCINKKDEALFQGKSKNGKKICNYSFWLNFSCRTEKQLINFAQNRYKILRKGCKFLLSNIYVVHGKDDAYYLGCNYECQKKKK